VEAKTYSKAEEEAARSAAEEEECEEFTEVKKPGIQAKASPT
jgi:hypothetical protein